jgi:predicted metal-binding membrane protein
VAMMLPSLMPMLRCYREAVGGRGSTRLGLLTACVGAGYFSVWTLFGLAVFSIGAGLAAVEMRRAEIARLVPMATGAIVFIAGWFQLSASKRTHLGRCRREHLDASVVPADATTAWRHGLRRGLECVRCCANLMLILIVVGVMDLRVMAAVTAAITVERLLPAGERLATTTGAVAIAAAAFMIARAAEQSFR